MSNKTDPYASEEETRALIVPDTRTPAEKKLDQMLNDRDAWEMGADTYNVLYKIAIELLEREAQPVAHAVIAGALFDFMGWLTSRKERLVLSSTDNASPAVDAITEFARMRSLSLTDARVSDWQSMKTIPAKCWKCGDSDQAFTDICQVPACGMR